MAYKMNKQEYQGGTRVIANGQNKYRLPKKVIPPKDQTVRTETAAVSSLRSDLLKTIVVVGLLVGVELILWWRAR